MNQNETYLDKGRFFILLFTLSLITPGCGGFLGSQSSSGDIESSFNDFSQGFGDTDNGSDLPAGFIQVGDMIVPSSDIVASDLQKYWPEQAESLRLTGRDVSSAGVAGERGRVRLWTNGRVPVVFGEGVSESLAQRLMQTWQVFSEFSNIAVVPRTNEPDYIEVVAYSSGCGGSSMVGRNGGRQMLSLSTGCGMNYVFDSVAIHEMMHALGIKHEQSRPDRDEYINIDYSNLNAAIHRQYAKLSDPLETTQVYDFRSIMHYSSFLFATDSRRPVITLKNPYQCSGPDDPYSNRCRTSSTVDIIPNNRQMTNHDKEILALLYGDANGAVVTREPTATEPTPVQPAPTPVSNPAPVVTTPVQPTPTQHAIRKDIQLYYNDALTRFNSVLAAKPNGTEVYFLSDQSGVTSAMAYGTGETRGDNLFNWGLNRIYYIYCEDKTPDGNGARYANRCIDGLRVYSSIQGADKIQLRFTLENKEYRARPTSIEQAQSTLLAFLEDQFGAANLSDDEESLLYPVAAATIELVGSTPVVDSPVQTPTQPSTTTPTESGPIVTEPVNPSTTVVQENGVRPDLQQYFEDAKSQFDQISTRGFNGVEMSFKSDETSTYTAYAYGTGGKEGDSLMNWGVNRVYYMYCEGRDSNGNQTTYYNRCLNRVVVTTKVFPDRYLIGVRSGGSQIILQSSSLNRLIIRFFEHLESKFGKTDLNQNERDLLNQF